MKTFKQLLAAILLMTFSLYVMVWFHHWSRATMHDELTGDMQRYDEAGIPCQSSRFYLYTYDMSYGMWMEARYREQ